MQSLHGQFSGYQKIQKRSTKTAYLEKICLSSYIQNLPANEISVFFNRQYFNNGLASDFGFLNVDRNQWKEQDLLMGFWKKISGQIGHFSPENGGYW